MSPVLSLLLNQYNSDSVMTETPILYVNGNQQRDQSDSRFADPKKKAVGILRCNQGCPVLYYT